MSNTHRTSTSSPGLDCQCARIVIADDEHLVASGLAHAVRGLGHKVAALAANGEDAVAAVAEFLPDLALLDIRMPGMDGIDVATAIFARFGTPSIMISAYSDGETVQRMQAAADDSGVYAYLLKPVSVDSLRVAIAVVQQRREIDKARDRRITALQRSIDQRKSVEQAKWRLVQRLGMNEQAAHEHLQRLSRDRRKSIAEVAASILQDRDLSGPTSGK